MIGENIGLIDEERAALIKSMERHKDALKKLSEGHTCTMQYRGIRENRGKPFEVFVCSICGREEWRHYSGCFDTIEGRM